MYKGNDHFIRDGKETDISVQDFWQWAYSDFVNNVQRGVLAEYIVSTAIGAANDPAEHQRVMWRPYDLLSPEGWRIEIKCAAYVQSWDSKHPDHVSYSIAPARVPDETGDYKDDAPKQRNSDCYVFALCKAMSADENILDLDLWEFFVLRTAVLDSEKPNQKSITLPSLLSLGPVTCTYVELREGIQSAMKREP